MNNYAFYKCIFNSRSVICKLFICKHIDCSLWHCFFFLPLYVYCFWACICLILIWELCSYDHIHICMSELACSMSLCDYVCLFFIFFSGFNIITIGVPSLNRPAVQRSIRTVGTLTCMWMNWMLPLQLKSLNTKAGSSTIITGQDLKATIWSFG